jgi:hypothetical protein
MLDMASVSTNKFNNWLASLGRKRKEVGIGLLILAATFAIAAIFLGYKYDHGSWPELSWGEVAALGFACAGAVAAACWCLIDSSFHTSDEDHGRLTVALLGSFIGLGLLVLSAVRAYKDWKLHIGPGLEAWQGKEGWHVWVCLLAAVAGLAILLFMITLVRTDAYSGRYARVSIYGYSAVQSCLMLLGILVFVNVVIYFLYPKPADWTASGMYTLNDQSQAILKSLKQPVKIFYLTASREDDTDIELLLNNAQNVTDKVQTEIVLRDRNIKRMAELREKYQLPLDSSGLLVTYETSDGKTDNQFIRADDMYDMPKRQGERPQFKGEGALMTAIDYLAEGKSRATIYFTQGNGELDLGRGMGARPPDQVGAALAERLRKSNYEVKGLILSPLSAQDEPGGSVVRATSVPEDAAAVVVAGPTQTLSPATVEALRKYMTVPNAKKKKGRLVVLAGATPDPDGKGKMLVTGLEGLLAEFSVDLTGSRVLTARERSRNPVNVRVIANPMSRNPIAEVLNQQEGPIALPMGNVRAIRRGAGGVRGGGSYQADEFLVVPVMDLIWTSDDLNDDGTELLSRARDGDKQAIDKINKQLSQSSVPVGVAVTEGDEGPNPMNPHARGGESTPRLVVIGNARFVSDEVVGGHGAQATYSYAVISSSLAWLREKPSGIGIPPADRKFYQMSPDTRIGWMIFLPLGLMVVGIVGLGITTWVVRRR